MRADSIEHGTLGRGLAYVRLGSGPDLLVAAGLTPDHRPLHGMGLRSQVMQLRPLARERTVWWLNRRQGLDPQAPGSRATLRVVGWLMGSAFWPITEPEDLLATIRAEDQFDVTDRLEKIEVPVLVAGGGRDQYYDSGQICVHTADLIPGARLILYPGRGHLGTFSGKQMPRDVLAFLAEWPPG